MNSFLKILSALFRLPAKPTQPSTPAGPRKTAPVPKPAVPAPGPTTTTKVAKSPITWIAIATLTVAGYEGYSAKPYVDTVGTGHPVTWCFGRTGADAPVPEMSARFTKAECEQMLGDDLVKKYDPPIAKCLKPDVYKALPPHRHAALVSFAYNLGPGALCKSAIVRYLNAGNVQAACDAFLPYDHADGRVLAGLVTRRKAERADCLRSD